MSTLDWALSAASRGWAVIPIWRANADGSCPCATPCGKSAGKHPDTRPGMAPRGTIDATTNPDTITRWFTDNPNHNYGIVCGGRSNGLMIQDVDVPEVAARILSAGQATVQTGSGCHIYMLTPNPGRTAIAFTPEPEHKPLGELRGHNMYVVGPGSIHPSGKEYALQRFKNDWPPIPSVPDVYKHSKELLEHYGGIRVDNIHPSEKFVEYVGRITAQDVPFQLDPANERDGLVISLIEGTHQTKDRSRYLFHTGSEIVRTAQQRGIVLSLEQLAGILKKIDAGLKTPKFAKRRDPDGEYAREAHAVLNGAATTAEMEPLPTTWPFVFGMTVGGVRSLRWLGGTQDVQIANFSARLTEEVSIEGGTDPTRRYLIDCELPGQPNMTLHLSPQDLSSPNHLRKTFYTQLPAQYIVRPGGWDLLFEAAKYMAQGQYARHVQYAEAGWTKDGAYMLPGAAGAVTAEGIDETLEFDRSEDSKLPERLYLYGANVEVPVTAATTELARQAFASLLECAQPDVLLPVLTHVMSGPLTKWLTPRYVLHMQGRTGLLKTAMCCTVLSLFGRFVDENWQSLLPETWISTPNALSGVLYVMKDTTVIIDDYKVSTIKSHREVATLIQAYADGTTRGRMNVDQSLRASLLPRGLILSTGEDIWEDQESTRARTFMVQIVPGSVDGPKLRIAQRYAENGALALAGGAYLHWLANKGADAIHSELESRRQALDERLAPSIAPDTHKRMQLNLMNMLAAADFIRSFVGDRMPELYPRFTEIMEVAIPLLLERAAQESKEAARLGTLERFLDWLLASLHAKRVCLLPHKVRMADTSKILGGGGQPMIGYYDASSIYVNEGLLMPVYRKDMAQQRENPAFGWTQLNSEIAALPHGKVSHSIRTDKGVMRFSVIPLTLVFPDGMEDVEEDTVPTFLQL